MRCSNQSAVAGRGVALGWVGLVDHYLDDDMMVVVGPGVDSDRSYYVTWPAGRTALVDGLVDWLRDDPSASMASRTVEQ